MNKVIILSGIDGSGKSSHAFKLMREAKLSGNTAEYVWLRGYGRTIFSFYILAFCRLLKVTEVKKLKNGTRVSLYPFYKYKPLRLLWPWAEFLDSFLFSALLVYRPFTNSKTIIIMDRSVMDTFVDVIADTKKPYFYETVEKCFTKLMPKNSIIILLEINEKTALTRKQDVVDLTYLIQRANVYRKIALKYKWLIVDTNADFDDAHDKILKYSKISCAQ